MKLASIEIVTSVKKHPNADSLDILTILGWQTVVKRDEYSEGDRVIFIVIDTILPNREWSEFLADKKNPEKPIRLKNAKIRGQYSQGLVLPISILNGNSFAAGSWQIGADVGAELGIKKYEKELPASLSGEIIGTFPTYLVAPTDEDNALSNLDIVEEVLKHPLTVTWKLDGSSCTIVVQDGKISHVCSRRMQIKESESNAFWVVANKIRPNIPTGWSGIIQGELCGPGIQGNQLNLLEPTLYVYQIKELHNTWMTYDEILYFTRNIIKTNIVPKIDYGYLKSLEVLQAIADNLALTNGDPAEGIVVRPHSYPSSGIGRPLGFKIINRNYKD
jgi:tRNA-binding EMAP/Myf-like protein